MDLTHAAPFLEYWEKVRGRTRRVVERIPEEHLEWSWEPGRFTLGDYVRHLAGIERWMYAENAMRRPSRYPGHGRELASGLPAVRDYFERLHAESMAIFRGLSDADFAARCVTPGGAEIGVGKWLRLMAEHEIHHRGQIYLSLAMRGVETPPLYGLTSEEVRAKSLPLEEETS
ncbi:MAG TPA: DinB family protein [Thermoanaerobaculia bacterium]|jgi:uncharacterized damage-inducible protein DinB